MRNVDDCHLWPQECCIQAPQNLTILGPQSHARSRQVYADLAWALHNCTCPGVYDWMPLSSSPGFNGRPAESCSRRASANSGSTDGATHTILQKATSGISSLSQWQRIRWQVHMWRGSSGPHAIPVIKESPPARPRVQSGWTWSGDLSKSVARGWGGPLIPSNSLQKRSASHLLKVTNCWEPGFWLHLIPAPSFQGSLDTESPRCIRSWEAAGWWADKLPKKVKRRCDFT